MRRIILLIAIPIKFSYSFKFYEFKRNVKTEVVAGWHTFSGLIWCCLGELTEPMKWMRV